jgi:hypothetical protein
LAAKVDEFEDSYWSLSSLPNNYYKFKPNEENTIFIEQKNSPYIFNIVIERDEDAVKHSFFRIFGVRPTLTEFKTNVIEAEANLNGSSENDMVGLRSLWLWGYKKSHCGLLEDIYEDLVNEKVPPNIQS